MPDRRAPLFVALCMKNGRRLSAKRSQFAELTDRELASLEEMVQQAIAIEDAAHR
jgi:hypothetical protein